MKISIIIVCYNAGRALIDTVNSILKQSYDDYEVIIQDGVSTDGSLDALPNNDKTSVYIEEDNGIYDAMNRAVKHISGSYVLFLNCGDYLYNSDTLYQAAKFLEEKDHQSIYYGDVFIRSRNGVVINPSSINDYVLATRTICHQSIFFPSALFDKYLYDYKHYPLAADYELYCRCYKKENFKLIHMNFIVVSYDCTGVSEALENKKKIIVEKRNILKNVCSESEYKAIRIKRIYTLYFLKEKIGISKILQKPYQAISTIRSRILLACNKERYFI